MKIVKQNLTNAVGSLQLCAGQETVSNAAIHAMHSIFEEMKQKLHCYRMSSVQ